MVNFQICRQFNYWNLRTNRREKSTQTI